MATKTDTLTAAADGRDAAHGDVDFREARTLHAKSPEALAAFLAAYNEERKHIKALVRWTSGMR